MNAVFVWTLLAAAPYPKTVLKPAVRTMLVPVPEIPVAASRQEIRPSAISHCGILNC